VEEAEEALLLMKRVVAAAAAHRRYLLQELLALGSSRVRQQPLRVNRCQRMAQ
jgi:hypothetical protein